MPDLPPEATWIGKDPGRMTVLTAKGPVLVHMFDFSQLNSVRTLPYLREWQGRYEPFGLRVVGVQIPRFPFGIDPGAVETGLERLGVDFPVVIDQDRILQASYGFEGWPSLFLWGRGGLLRWFQFGEGDYEGTELAIRQALKTAGKAAPEPGDIPAESQPEGLPELPGMTEPIRPTDTPGAEVMPPGDELIPAEDGPFTIADGDGFDIEYQDAGYGSAHVTATGFGSLTATLDGEPLDPVTIDGPGLYTLVGRATTGPHRLSIDLRGEPEIWSVSFAPRVRD